MLPPITFSVLVYRQAPNSYCTGYSKEAYLCNSLPTISHLPRQLPIPQYLSISINR